MMLRTHWTITIFAVLLFLPSITDKTVFIVVALIATMLPDIDSGFSTLGKLQATKFVQFLVKHRGVLHSFTFCVFVSIVFAFFLPVLALPFFIAYSLHLFADSFTVSGIRPFWPLKNKSSWKLRTGSYGETSLFVVLLIVDIFLVIFMFINIF